MSQQQQQQQQQQPPAVQTDQGSNAPQGADASVNRSRREFTPKDNVLKIAVKNLPRTCKTRARIILDTFNNVEIHALGEATPTAVRVAENLQRQGLAEIRKIKTETYTSDQTGGPVDRQGRKKIKIIINLEKKK